MTDRLRQRLHAQLLTGRRGHDVVGVVRHLYAVQAQDLNAARLAIRSRSTGLHRSDVDTALTDAFVVVGWLNRGTLHLVLREDYWTLHALTTPGLRTANRRRLEQSGVSPAEADRGVAMIDDALRSDGPQSRAQLRDRLEDAGIPVAGQALVHLLFASGLDGVSVRGPVRGGEQTFAAAESWVGPRPAVDLDDATAQLAHRYLVAHGPASPQDLARWAGIPLGRARAGLAALDLTHRPDGLLARPDQAGTRSLPHPVLLGPFEPVLLGWVSRTDILGQDTSHITSNGIFKAFALVDGRSAGTWTRPTGRVQVAWIDEPPTDAVHQALERDAEDLDRFLS